MKKITILFLYSSMVFAKDLQFESLWSDVEKNALSIKATNESVLAAGANKNRSENHWYPTVYATGNSFVSNDPGTNMFGLLSQREIKQTDFQPNDLNHPGSKLFTKAALGVNLSLYEGGMKQAMIKVSSFNLESKKSEAEKSKIEFYAETSKNYFSLNSLNRQGTELLVIKKTLDSIISKYQIGNKANMLGYSGLLGLKSLRNKLDAIADENSTRVSVYTNALEVLSNKKQKFDFKSNESIDALLDEYFITTNTEYAPSEKVKSLEFNANAAAEVIGVEKSRNLPRVGVFAESYAFNGARNTGTGFSTGVYLNWNLFSGNDIGASDEALHNSHAAKYYAEAIAQREKVEFAGINEMELTLKRTLVNLEDTQKLLDEQTTVANNLFKNGMINALQLVEVLSRRIELINSKTEVELNLINAKVKKVQLTNNKIRILQ